MSETMITCPFCGHEYRPEESRSACAACPFHKGKKGCGWLRCPQCGYETPEVRGWMRRLMGRTSAGRPAPAGTMAGIPAASNCSPSGSDNRTKGQTPISVDSLPNKATRSLAQLSEGVSGWVAHLRMDDPRELQKLMAFGILPGAPIRLLQSSPSYVFQVGQTQVAVDRRIAEKIFVAAQ